MWIWGYAPMRSANPTGQALEEAQVEDVALVFVELREPAPAWPTSIASVRLFFATR